MSFGKAIRTCLSKYATFSSRVRLSKYWFLALFLITVGVASGLVEVVLDTRGGGEISWLVMVLPALLVCRLHDIDRSGWWALLPFVLIIIPLVTHEVVLLIGNMLGGPDAGYLAPVVKFGKAIRTCLSKYASFSGRARRSECWFFTLFLIIVGVASGLVEVFSDTRGVGDISLLVLLLPGSAVLVRRLHDIDRSGWWVLLPFVPTIFAQIIFQVVIFCAIANGAMLSPYAMENQVPAGRQPLDIVPWVMDYLIVFVVLIIGIVLFIWACTRGTPGPNRYGPDPFAI